MSAHLMTQTIATTTFSSNNDFASNDNFAYTVNSPTNPSSVNNNSLYIMTRRKLIFGTCKGCGKPNDKFNKCNPCEDWINQQMAYLKQMENLVETRRLTICEQKLKMCKIRKERDDGVNVKKDECQHTTTL
ncbi:16394_t:CDS:1 [Acaulospora morrowiae]|uniref:16394_t:CDS:1 n=1 Tax=Acaulospora morrowiae TaxID=94023 RepID=A0A9N8VBB5_9GLOM|nr:16394_t:CDS:1 [Acaulospora morrowiae]